MRDQDCGSATRIALLTERRQLAMLGYSCLAQRAAGWLELVDALQRATQLFDQPQQRRVVAARVERFVKGDVRTFELGGRVRLLVLGQREVHPTQHRRRRTLDRRGERDRL